MPSSVTVNFLTTQHKASTGVAAAFPDVCKTPAPPAPVPPPIPYPNVGNSAMASAKVTKRVGDDTQKVVVKGSAYAMTSGDEPGVAMGVISNKIKGKSEVKNQSVNVKFEGKGIGRLSDPHGNNVGGQLNAASPAVAQPPNAGGEATAKTPEQEDACKELDKNNKVESKGNQSKKERQKQIAEENGMAGEHADAIRDYCGKEKVSATFRSGNPAQVQHINGTGPHCKREHKDDKTGQPLPGKPMKVKDKSINLSKRPGSVKSPGGTVDEALNKKIADNNLEGLVGVYDKHGKLRGVRNTTGVQSIETIPPVKGNTYAGDYDGHDFFGKDGKRITGGTPAEKKMIGGLNGAMGRDGSEGNPEMVMHGPQANYTEYCEKTGEEINPDLQKPDFSEKEPLMAFKDGEMYVLKTDEDLDNFYKCQGAEKPKEWN